MAEPSQLMTLSTTKSSSVGVSADIGDEPTLTTSYMLPLDSEPLARPAGKLSPMAASAVNALLNKKTLSPLDRHALSVPSYESQDTSDDVSPVVVVSDSPLAYVLLPMTVAVPSPC